MRYLINTEHNITCCKDCPILGEMCYCVLVKRRIKWFTEADKQPVDCPIEELEDVRE